MKKNYLISIILILPFCIYSQNLESISPAGAIAGQVLDVVITGSGTHFTQGDGTNVDFAFRKDSEAVVNFLSVVNDTSLVANISIPITTLTGAYGVFVYNSIDDTLNTSFHVTGRPLPAVVSMNPSNGNAGQTVNVTITGTNTHFKQDSTAVAIKTLPDGPAVANFVTVISDTVLQANITLSPKTYTGLYTAVLYTLDDGTFEHSGFQVQGVTPPSLDSIFPANGNAGQTLMVTIIGDHTHFIPNKTTVNFEFDQSGGTLASSVNVTSDTSLEATVTIPAGMRTGSYNVSVTDSIDGTLTFGNGFYVYGLTPSLDSILPSRGSYGQTLTVTIKGKHTHFVQDQTLVHFGFDSTGTAVNSVNVTSDTLLEVNLTIPPKTIVGSYTVSVMNPIDGAIYKNNAFYVGGGVIALSPSVAYPSQTLDVIITGVQTSSATPSDVKVRFVSDSAITSEIIVNAITIPNDSSIKINITIPPNQPSGSYNVHLTIVDGAMLLPNAFRVKEQILCQAGYTTSYDQINNTFTLTLDSITSQAAGFYWDFGDGTTSTDKLPKHTFTKDTLYNVCLKIKTLGGDSCAYCHIIGKDSLGDPVTRTSGFSIQVVPFKPVVTGISAVVNSEAGVMLYPNPANHTLTIELLNLANVNSNMTVLTIYSIEGQLLIQQATIKDKTEMDISELAKGMYILQIKTGAKSEVLKFIKE